MKHYDRSRKLCEWERLDEWRNKVRASLAANESSRISPFHLLSLPGISAAEQRQCADLWLLARLAASQAERDDLAFQFVGPARPKIRLGYLSCDFHDHATAYLLVEMLEAHDKDRFEIYAYSYGADDGGDMRQRLLRCFDRFVDLSELSIADSAKAIHADQIDILIDLKGYTRGTRTEILTYRPAPIQVNYLGYPSTLGGDFCDYIVTDPYLTPPGSAADYSEAFAYLPDSYQPHGRHAEIGKLSSRVEQGLPEHGFVFCCFNQAYKIMPEIFDVWCRLLYNTPGSVLWLLKNASAKGRLRNEAYQRGIVPDRLIFADELPQIEHLGRLGLADLVLDTAPYNAHTTASDALWVGVPMITCAGDTFPSRVAGSLLRAIGLDELIATDLDTYYTLAHDLANCPEQLADVNRKLAANRLNTPLFDTLAYTLHLEALFQAMWRRHQDGLQPITIESH
ncbi:UDP-N-acetylglucosamine-peptide N-acetylglucosaminyltransferase [Methylomonas sp. MED-D]|uniref:UDP-N-acetylglucosamine-peptide N-acetylglucosaminyltransferase n=1 Tax=Methylomonas koyamae TaxID=702114 RepID=A0A177NAK9_9GAMM|nr:MULTISPECIES: UDP-N-acetylglucosamine-peptide N-acetylglucosaminyltransferase [Methylomonas]MDT4332074.1 UDP-N-acetylglucosamine-peptide N-acetylglucosaminyltransferase [Methylomonas sp. MV1]OAI15086.1 UDP-N-acetylglucosamine-peptide N-acetylglucosaminyltransferase [Methylomonas koyamae]OHX35582.1 UDP-N-acetylglucosamine-peptide N-acetylglucosaminyltransferase [Methylomonas sp. LWB]WGS85749.1 UDP-N-acetylglucosamine-peptide N-acetylglucosaminyltransferase [Methylomonas sp. UP202]